VSLLKADPELVATPATQAGALSGEQPGLFPALRVRLPETEDALTRGDEMATIQVCDKCGERIKRDWRIKVELQKPGVTASDRCLAAEACSEKCAHELLDEMSSRVKC
jgi:hypothetical protein